MIFSKKALLAAVVPGIAAQLENYDRDVRMCTQSTSYVGPEHFQYDLKNIFRTAEPCPTETEVKLNFGSVPSWINGHWFRTGPGIFEFGDEQYLNWADGQGFWQKISFNNGKVTYKSDFQYSVHHVKNQEAGYIMYPEVGTWGNPKYCDAENDPTNEQLLDWLATDTDFVSDNAYVSFFALGGAMYVSGETYWIWRVDPVTLKGIERIQLDELFKETLFKNNKKSQCASLATHLAHYHYDAETDEYFGAFTCMTESLLAPKIRYVVYKIPNARGQLSSKPESPRDVWSRGIIIAEIDSKHNSPSHLDMRQEYFHDFALTKNYIVLGVTNLEIDFMKMPQLMVNRQPMGYGALFDEEHDGSWFVIKRENNVRGFNKIQHNPPQFRSSPFFATHVINAYEDEERNVIVFDTTHADNNRQFGTTWMANYTSSNSELPDIFHFVAPLQTPVRFEFDLNDFSRSTKVEPRPLFKKGHLPSGGADFPVINYGIQRGQNYDYAFFGGFREVFAVDSLYQLKISTGESICRFKEGYLPAEPRFVAKPGSTGETDGVILIIWMPLLPELRPMLNILNPETLGLIAELELPVSFLSAGVHGQFFTFED